MFFDLSFRLSHEQIERDALSKIPSCPDSLEFHTGRLSPREARSGQSKAGLELSSPTHVFPVASEECDLVKAEAQGFLSNIQCFSALLLISLASLDAEED